jgi:TonB family protein
MKVTKSLSDDLDKKAVQAVKKWEFKPGTNDGKPVAAGMNLAVQFKLK